VGVIFRVLASECGKKNVTSFEWPVTDTVVQYSVITTIYIYIYIYIYSSMKSHLVILPPCP
jgi:hypothetical protein